MFDTRFHEIHGVAQLHDRTWLCMVSHYHIRLLGLSHAQVGNLRIAYSVHTAPGADPGGNTKDNQVGPEAVGLQKSASPN